MYLNKKELKFFYMFGVFFVLAMKYRCSSVLGDYIAAQFRFRTHKRRHVAFMKFMYYYIKFFNKMPFFIKGSYSYFCLGIYGKVNAALRARRYFIRSKNRSTNLPLKRIMLLTDYSLTYAETRFGTYGIRI